MHSRKTLYRRIVLFRAVYAVERDDGVQVLGQYHCKLQLSYPLHFHSTVFKTCRKKTWSSLSGPRLQYGKSKTLYWLVVAHPISLKKIRQVTIMAQATTHTMAIRRTLGRWGGTHPVMNDSRCASMDNFFFVSTLYYRCCVIAVL